MLATCKGEPGHAIGRLVAIGTKNSDKLQSFVTNGNIARYLENTTSHKSIDTWPHLSVLSDKYCLCAIRPGTKHP